jgi:two-component system sensor histidine kinase ChvG
MKLPRIALSIRAQLLLVLTVFLALPWLGVEYVREIERVLRDAQERTLAGTAQAVAIALHDRPQLFAASPIGRTDPIAAFAGADKPVLPPISPEIAEIIAGLSRTTARISVVDREQDVLARAGALQRPGEPPAATGGVGRALRWLEAHTLHAIYALMLEQPTEDFADESPAGALQRRRDVEGALAGILTIDRRRTADGRAQIVSAAHPIWVGDQVRGAVLVEESGNAVLAQRNRAFERLFNIVLAVLLVGSLALTAYATWLSARIRRLRDDAERAIDEHGRVRGALTGSTARDEIGDLARSFGSVLARLADYADYQQKMAARLSHELRTPVAVVRSSLDNLRLAPTNDEARVYMDRAQEGLARLTQILTRMSEATRLEQGLSEVRRERFDLAAVVAGCVEGYRLAYPAATIAYVAPPAPLVVCGAPDLIAQLLDKLDANAVEFAQGAPVTMALAPAESAEGTRRAELTVANEGPLLPAGTTSRLFDSMVSLRPEGSSGQPHLGLGLYIVRVIVDFHGGTVTAADRADGKGVVVTVSLPLA